MKWTGILLLVMTTVVAQQEYPTGTPLVKDRLYGPRKKTTPDRSYGGSPIDHNTFPDLTHGASSSQIDTSHAHQTKPIVDSGYVKSDIQGPLVLPHSQPSFHRSHESFIFESGPVVKTWSSSSSFGIQRKTLPISIDTTANTDPFTVITDGLPVQNVPLQIETFHVGPEVIVQSERHIGTNTGPLGGLIPPIFQQAKDKVGPKVIVKGGNRHVNPAIGQLGGILSQTDVLTEPSYIDPNLKPSGIFPRPSFSGPKDKSYTGTKVPIKGEGYIDPKTGASNDKSYIGTQSKPSGGYQPGPKAPMDKSYTGSTDRRPESRRGSSSDSLPVPPIDEGSYAGPSISVSDFEPVGPNEGAGTQGQLTSEMDPNTNVGLHDPSPIRRNPFGDPTFDEPASNILPGEPMFGNTFNPANVESVPVLNKEPIQPNKAKTPVLRSGFEKNYKNLRSYRG